MKEVTLKFREVAVDGLPNKDMENVYAVFRSGIYDTTFSKFHNAFGCLYAITEEEIHARKLIWGHPLCWIPADEMHAAIGCETL